MTITEFGSTAIVADPDVYAPQEDSWLLCNSVARSGVLDGATVLDMCTGSGAVAVTVAGLGAHTVTAFDISALAVACATRNAASAGVGVDVRLGSFADATALPSFDLVLCNPPYVPSEEAPAGMGLHRAWDAGADGRVVLDMLCTNAIRLVAPGGSLMLVQSEFADPERTVDMLTDAGFDVSVVETSIIDFGPVMHARAEWLESVGRLEVGRRTEKLVVIRADRQ